MKKVIFIIIFTAIGLFATAQKYVDLGLRSGTLWKDANEQKSSDGNSIVHRIRTEKTNYHIPTPNDWKELKSQCTWEWTDDGYIVTGPNGLSITLPKTSRKRGYYYSYPNSDYKLTFSSKNIEFKVEMSDEFAIRLVKSSKEQLNEEQESASTQKFIDLGLSSGTLWENNYESRFEPDSRFAYERKTNREYPIPSRDNCTICLPTFSEWEELLNECKWEWVGNGYIVNGPNGKSIFIRTKAGRMTTTLWPKILYSKDGTQDSVGYWSYDSGTNQKSNIVFIKGWNENIQQNDVHPDLKIRYIKRPQHIQKTRDSIANAKQKAAQNELRARIAKNGLKSYYGGFSLKTKCNHEGTAEYYYRDAPNGERIYEDTFSFRSFKDDDYYYYANGFFKNNKQVGIWRFREENGCFGDEHQFIIKITLNNDGILDGPFEITESKRLSDGSLKLLDTYTGTYDEGRLVELKCKKIKGHYNRSGKPIGTWKIDMNGSPTRLEFDQNGHCTNYQQYYIDSQTGSKKTWWVPEHVFNAIDHTYIDVRNIIARQLFRETTVPPYNF